jgi:hypothetical protein
MRTAEDHDNFSQDLYHCMMKGEHTVDKNPNSKAQGKSTCHLWEAAKWMRY